MLARLADALPTAQAGSTSRSGDGFRAIVEVGDARIAIHSRNGRRLDHLFREVADGELVSQATGGGLSFEGLLRRLNRGGGAPAALVVFDLLEVDSVAVTHRPLIERRRLLGRAVSAPDSRTRDGRK
jgi:ATP-dependent DNA ligase